MDLKTKLFEPLLLELTDFLKTSLTLGKYKMIKQVSIIGTNLIFFFVLLSLLALVLLFLAAACSFYLGHILGSNTMGFLIVAGIFLLMLLLILIFKNKIYNFFHQRILQSLLS